MRKIQLDGKKIKELRDGRDRSATQKEFAHEIRVSERRLRAIENKNALVTTDVADRIARALNKPLQILFVQDDGPPSPQSVPSLPGAEPVKAARKEHFLPRFDEAVASVISDEARLFQLTNGTAVVISHVLTALTSETSVYAEELISILRSLTWQERGPLECIDSLEEIGLRRRIRELLVLLKGNDVWVYADSNIKTFPESFEVQPPSDQHHSEMQTVIAFGPPGEYGETTIRVPIDRGQPSILVW